MPTTEEVTKQSESAYNQWCVQWREHAKYNSKHEMKSFNDFSNTGVGKPCLLVANGYSFEKYLEYIPKDVDIMCCDKTLGHLIKRGIKPKYCMIADANVDEKEYLLPYKDQLQDTYAFINVCGNTKWPELGNWKGVYFFVNKDVLHSELEFSKLSGCTNMIAAGTNVSNGMLISLTQCDDHGPRNAFGYDCYLLIGYDYSWRYGGKYYAFDNEGNGKSNYMRHINLYDNKNNYCYTSNNLLFSAKWLDQYIKTYNLPVVQCSEETILSLPYGGKLKDHIGYKHKPEDVHEVGILMNRKRELEVELKKHGKRLSVMATDHRDAFLDSVM